MISGAQDEPIGLNCPECGTLAVFLIGDGQAFCDVDGCRILMWDPTQTRAEMLAEGIHEIDLGGHARRRRVPGQGGQGDGHPPG